MSEELTDFKIETIINNDAWNNGTPSRNMDWLVRVFKLGMNTRTESAEIQKLREQLDQAVDFIQVVADWKNAYPESVFPPIENESYLSMCASAGLSPDRVSAHVLRYIVSGYSESAEKILQSTKEQK